MSTDDYAEDFFQGETDQTPSYEDGNQTVSQQPPPPPSVSFEQFSALQAELAALKANPLQSIGYQPVQQNQPKWTPDQEAVSKAFLEAQGVVTKQDLLNERINDAAEANGFAGKEHVESAFRAEWYGALQSQNTQKQAELKQLASLYDSNPRAAIKAFKQMQDRPTAPLQNQSFGHVPSNGQQTRQQPRFANNQEFLAYGRSNPVEFKQIYDEWMSDTTGTKNPFPIQNR
jgi:hypothetical protein